MRENKTVTILGEEWNLVFNEDNPEFAHADGFTDTWSRTIHVNPNSLNENLVLRHELIHAFLSESGLDVNSNPAENWATNEEMIDWFAKQAPKIFKLYTELGALY